LKRAAAARPRAVRRSKAFLARTGFRACPGIPSPAPCPGWPAGAGSVSCWTRCSISLVSPGARPATRETSWPAGVRIISARRAFSKAAAVAQRATGLLPDRLARKVTDVAAVDRLDALHVAVKAVRRGGTVSVSGVYGGEIRLFRLDVPMASWTAAAVGAAVRLPLAPPGPSSGGLRWLLPRPP
jgi:hypothetical protein